MRFFYLPFLFFFFSFSLCAQNADSVYMQQHYEKAEYKIPMRDGVALFAVVYTPKDKSKTYPILLNRTPYNASSYADFKMRGHPSRYLVQDGDIFVFQDVRGRYMSGGLYNNMTPNIPGNEIKNRKAIDESSDTWDSIDWMVKNLKNNNGKAGIYGISYPSSMTLHAI